MSLIPPDFHPFTLAARGNEGDTITLPIGGNYLYLYEADYELEVSLNNKNFFPIELAKGCRCLNGQSFSSMKLRNKATAENRGVMIYATDCEYIDNSVNVIERRNGSASSMIPGGLSEVAPIIATGVAQKLADYDANRAEIWLWSDSATNDAWWGADNTLGTENFRRIGQSLDGFTKIKTKAEVWVRAAAGVKIGAMVVTF